jgi:hypothetical protein
MNWDAVAAIAEALAVLGVIASLVYVALQVKQNSKLIDQSILATRSAMVHEINVSFARFYELLAQDSELSDIYQRGIRGESLTDNEVFRFEALLYIYVAWLEDADHQHMSGVYFEEDDTDPVEGLAAIFRPLLSSPIGRHWWSQTAEELTTPSLYTKINKIMTQWDIPED